MKITEKIINKIEGEAYLTIYGDEVVDFVEIEFFQYRGIEEYLKGKDVLDALVINPRICGICGHSHLLATAKAIENAIGAKVSRKAEILREVTSLLEIVENHIKWFYITLFPTQIKDKKYIFKAVKFSSEISKAIALIAGQYPHNSYMLPGGITSDLTNLDILKLKDILSYLNDEIQKEIIDKSGNSKDLKFFFENLPKDIGKSVNRFLVLGENGLFRKNGEVEFIKEDKFKNHFNLFYKNEFFEVGPLARGIVNKIPLVLDIYKKNEDSIYTRIFARLYEIVYIMDYLLRIIKEIDLCEPSFIKNEIKDSKGIVAIEAPRGSLIHSIEIKDSKIKEYNIIVPTQFNLSSFKKSKPSPAQKALIGEKKEYVDTIFKCFDICAVCIGH